MKFIIGLIYLCLCGLNAYMADSKGYDKFLFGIASVFGWLPVFIIVLCLDSKMERL